MSTSSKALFAAAWLLAACLGARAEGIVAVSTAAAGQLPGTATNDNASAGNVGEFISSSVASGSAVSLTTATPANITSVSLTAGDWDCSASAARTFGATTSVTILKSSISTTTAADGTLATGTMVQRSTPAQVPVTDYAHVVPPVRISLNATTSVFLVADDTFTVSTDKGYGFLRCRRAR